MNFEEDGLEFLGFELSWLQKNLVGGSSRIAKRVPKALTNRGKQ